MYKEVRYASFEEAENYSVTYINTLELSDSFWMY